MDAQMVRDVFGLSTEQTQEYAELEQMVNYVRDTRKATKSVRVQRLLTVIEEKVLASQNEICVSTVRA